MYKNVLFCLFRATTLLLSQSTSTTIPNRSINVVLRFLELWSIREGRVPVLQSDSRSEEQNSFNAGFGRRQQQLAQSDHCPLDY